MTNQDFKNHINPIKAIIRRQIDAANVSVAHNNIHLIRSIALDDEEILNVVIISDVPGETLPQSASVNLSTELVHYLAENELDLYPVSYEIDEDDWPAFRQGFADALAIAN